MNLKIRLKNKAFWIACIVLIVLILQYAQGFISTDFNVPLIEKILNAAVICAVAMGVIVDPTTPSISDSEQVLKKKDKKDRDENNGDDLNAGSGSP
ncbi:phage holin [Eubacterium maltosivorans]|uniref:phage holin n=1 Tax=Eubacterium maltosivorans TaxID=2041044 RepID=UPI003A90AC68